MRTTGLVSFVSIALVIAVAAVSLGGGSHPASAGMAAIGHEGTFFNGDANCDDAINSLDALEVLQFEAGLLDRVAFPESADPNGDGEIDGIDAVLILQFDAGLMPGKRQKHCLQLL